MIYRPLQKERFCGRARHRARPGVWARAKRRSCCAASGRPVQEGKQALLLVPEQYTYDAERMLLETLGGAAFYAEALGFSRLCERVLEEAGGGARLFLSPEGRRMALRGVLDEKRGSLKLYGGVSARSGFLERAGDLIDVFKAADLPPEALFSAAERVKDPLLCEKLRELGTIYGGLQERMAGRYARRADKLCLLTRKTAAVRLVQRNGGVCALAPRLFVRRALLRHFYCARAGPPAA